MRPEEATKYMHCWETDYYLKWHYRVFQNDFILKQIYLGHESKICLEAYKSGVRPIYMIREKLGRKSVANTDKLRYPSLPSANI